MADFDYTACHCCERWVPAVEPMAMVVVRRLNDLDGTYYGIRVAVCSSCEAMLTGREPVPVE